MKMYYLRTLLVFIPGLAMQLGWGQHSMAMVHVAGEDDKNSSRSCPAPLCISQLSVFSKDGVAFGHDIRTTGKAMVQTYEWIGVSSASWMDPVNWNPSRESPAETDILIFRIGFPRVITNVPSERVGQISITGNTSITLMPISTRTLTLTGGSGDDLVVEAGSQLNITGSLGLTIALEHDATALIGGSVEFTNGTQRIVSVDENGILFQAGSCFTAGTGFNGNPFGKTTQNSAVFQAGSCYISMTGEDPFALAAPGSVIVFQTGSLFKLTTDHSVKFSGRTFGDIEVDASMKTLSPNGDNPYSIDNLTITNGTLNLKMVGTGGHSIKGNISVASGATLNFAPTSSGTIYLNGHAQQTISGEGTITSTGYATLELQNPEGLIFNATDAVLSGGLGISSGTLTLQTGSNLTVMGTLSTRGTTEELKIEQGGSLILLTAGVNATIEQTIEGWSEGGNGWHLMSSPVAGQEINADGGFVTGGAENDFDFFSWSEPYSVWVNFKNTTVSPTFSEVNGGTTEFRMGHGYMVAYEQTGMKQFKGMMTVGSHTITGLTKTDASASQAWHLLGNPYPSALMWDNSWENFNTGAVCQVWNESLNDYSAIQNGPIPSMNGFMVEVLNNNASVAIPAAKRVHSAQAWYKALSEPCIKLTVMAADRSSGKETVVKFSPMGTSGFDPWCDGHFLKGNGPVFCSVAGEEWLSYNTLSDAIQPAEVPLIFIKNESESYTLEVCGLKSIQSDLILCDLKTGVNQNLSIDSVYNFTSSEADLPLRFKLLVGDVGIGTPINDRIHVYTVGNILHVCDAVESGVEIVNMAGQVMLRYAIHDEPDHSRLVNLPSGIYVVRIAARDGIYSRSVVFY